jgi:deazaflavin-dependent oxidoreductase (nitroreductase family)
MTPDLKQKFDKPTGLLKVFFKLPILAYRTGMGFFLGKRFIYVEHVGRKSGLTRRSVLEVIRYDKEKDIFYIASGYGTKSDWFKNIKKTPDVKIQVGMRKANTHVEFLSEDRTEEEILDYAHRHPTAIKQLAKLIGYTLTGEQGELKSLSKKWPVLAFYPKE